MRDHVDEEGKKDETADIRRFAPMRKERRKEGKKEKERRKEGEKETADEYDVRRLGRERRREGIKRRT